MDAATEISSGKSTPCLDLDDTREISGSSRSRHVVDSTNVVVNSMPPWSRDRDDDTTEEPSLRKDTIPPGMGDMPPTECTPSSDGQGKEISSESDPAEEDKDKTKLSEEANDMEHGALNDGCDTHGEDETPLGIGEPPAIHGRVASSTSETSEGLDDDFPAAAEDIASGKQDNEENTTSELPGIGKHDDEENATSELNTKHAIPFSPLELTEVLDSEQEEEDNELSNDIINNNNNNNNHLPWWYPRCRGKPAFYGTKEALGWACTAVAQAGVLIGTGAFILPALSKLAKEEAGCETEAPSGEDIPVCEGTVYGFKPSSLLTIMSTVAGLVSAFIIPPVGAVVDYTSHRRLIGRWLSFFYSLLILSLAFLGEDSWFALSIVLLIVVSIGWAQAMLFNAYLPELTDDEARLNEFSKSFTVLIFTTMVVYLAVVTGIGIGFGFADDDVALARCAAIVAFVLSCFMFYASWWLLFEEREAFHVLPKGQSLLGAGFRQVYRTSKRIWNDYKALKWFYMSICFGDAAIQSLSVIAITYITNQLEFSSQEVGVAALVLLLGSIPGAIVGGLANSKLNPIKGSALAVFAMSVGTILAALVLKGPGQQGITYLFSFLWGFGTGWKYTGDRVLAAGIIPEGQDAELMGFYMFCGQIFAWAPSLIFTILNEAGVSMRIGFGLLGIIFLGALVCYYMMGDYAEAVGAAARLRVDTIPLVAKQLQVDKDGQDRAGDFPPEEAPAL